MKVLLEDPANVRDLFAVVRSDLVPLIDFDRLALVRTTFVARDFRHVEADVVLTAPLRARGKRDTTVWLYLLIEHQSEPDPLMPIRLLDYVIQIIKAQLRDWSNTHRSFAGFRAQPVLPVVLYTGTTRWETPGRLIDLMEYGEPFRRMTPDFEPIFANLPALAPDRLVSAGGAFGQVLRLVQCRKARALEFRRLLEEAVQGLEALPEDQRVRWLELLSYIHMMVYHDRIEAEREPLQELIESSVQTDPHRQEVNTVKRTIAEAMKDEGRREARRTEAVRLRQETLLELLQVRFGQIPEATAATINACREVRQLKAWLRAFAVANTLDDIGIK